jgi:hypothetical protein
MPTNIETLSFTEEAEVRMQELAEFLAKDTRVNLALTSQLHDHDVLLTPGGFLMLAIPLIEGTRMQNAGAGSMTMPPPEVVREAIRGLLDALKTEPAPADAKLGESEVRTIVVGRKPSLLRPRQKMMELGPRENVRSSFSVIRAFWKRFGSIAPFSG